MDLDRLEEFLIIADCRSIKKAAETLNVSPATLSSRLSVFEESLNSELFLRSKNGLSLTPAGHLFYQDALSIHQKYSSLKKNILSANDSSYDNIRIAIAGTAIPFFLGPFLDQVNLKQPDLHLEIYDDNFCSIEDGLAKDLVDLYFAPAMSSVNYENIVKIPVVTAHQYVLLPVSHPLSERTTLSLEELNGEQFLLYPETKEPCIRQFQLENLKASGIHYTTYDAVNSTVFYKMMIPIGKGILLTPNQLIAGTPRSVLIPIKGLSCSAPLCLFYKKDHTLPKVSRFIEDFFAFIKEEAYHEHRKTL